MELYAVLEWDLEQLANALGLSSKTTQRFFQDGRRSGPLVEQILASRFPFTRAPEGADHDLVTTEGERWEVRTITKSGLFFSPSSDVGAGRCFSSVGLRRKLNRLRGYILCDVTEFPTVPVWMVSRRKVLDWQVMGALVKGRANWRTIRTLLAQAGSNGRLGQVVDHPAGAGGRP